MVGGDSRALALAGLGLYGTISYSVGLRTVEIGIRMAMGAVPGTIQRLVLTEAMISLALALAIGLPMGLAANRFLGALLPELLFGLSPLDPTAVGLAVLFMAGISVAASYLPARRAARVDPMVALRHW